MTRSAAVAKFWPSWVSPIHSKDRICCIQDLHAGKCPYHNWPRPHNFLAARKIQQIVEHYGRNPRRLPSCVPLKSSEINELLRRAMGMLGLVPELPAAFKKGAPVTSADANYILYKCLIEPMEGPPAQESEEPPRRRLNLPGG